MVAAVAGLVLSGCGNESGGVANPPPSPSPSTPTVTQSTPVGAGLPLTVSRRGGIAGFDDQVVISTDGVATVSSRGKKALQCKLDPGLVTTISTAAEQVDWASLVSTKSTFKHPDDMILAVTANGKTAPLDDPQLKPLVAPLTTLLTEATNPPGKLCKQI